MNKIINLITGLGVLAGTGCSELNPSDRSLGEALDLRRDTESHQVKVDEYARVVGLYVEHSGAEALYHRAMRGLSGEEWNDLTPIERYESLSAVADTMDVDGNGVIETEEAYGLVWPHMVPRDRNPHLAQGETQNER